MCKYGKRHGLVFYLARMQLSEGGIIEPGLTADLVVPLFDYFCWIKVLTSERATPFRMLNLSSFLFLFIFFFLFEHTSC